MRKSLKMAKDSSSIVRPRKREGLNIRPRLFLIDRVSDWSRFTEKTDKRWLLPLSFLIPVLSFLSLTHIITTLDFLRLALSPYKIREHSRELRATIWENRESHDTRQKIEFFIILPKHPF